MKETVKYNIEAIINQKMKQLNRSDLFREPLVGISDADDLRYGRLKEIIGPWHLNPDEILANAQSVISYYIPFTKHVSTDPKKRQNGSYVWSEAYQEINVYFDTINQSIVDYLKENGYDATGIKATHTYDPATMQCQFSHRSAAVIAGLGDFGFNRLVITSRGSGGRFCSVITTAKIDDDQEPYPTKCLRKLGQKCDLCLNICPVDAFHEEDFSKFACQDELNKNGDLLKKETDLVLCDTCGKCLSICPFVYLT